MVYCATSDTPFTACAHRTSDGVCMLMVTITNKGGGTLIDLDAGDDLLHDTEHAVLVRGSHSATIGYCPNIDTEHLSGLLAEATAGRKVQHVETLTLADKPGWRVITFHYQPNMVVLP